MTNLIDFATMTGALVASVLISLLIEWLSLEAFFRWVAPVRRVAAARGPEGTRKKMR